MLVLLRVSCKQVAQKMFTFVRVLQVYLTGEYMVRAGVRFGPDHEETHQVCTGVI